MPCKPTLRFMHSSICLISISECSLARRNDWGLQVAGVS
jgi:hypothetical protein